MVLRFKTLALVRQEVWGLLLAHFAMRGLVHEATLQANEGPDRLSFSHAMDVTYRKILHFATLGEILEECTVGSRGWPAEPARTEGSRALAIKLQ